MLDAIVLNNVQTQASVCLGNELMTKETRKVGTNSEIRRVWQRQKNWKITRWCDLSGCMAKLFWCGRVEANLPVESLLWLAEGPFRFPRSTSHFPPPELKWQQLWVPTVLLCGVAYQFGSGLKCQLVTPFSNPNTVSNPASETKTHPNNNNIGAKYTLNA
jgi:hypothetical protein